MKNLLFIFAFFLFFLTLPIFILSFFPVTKKIYQMTNVRHNQSFELSQVSEDLLKQTLEFMSNGEKTYQLNISKFTIFQLTENEQAHMAEVKILFQTAKKILAFSTILATLIFFTSQSKIKKELLIQFKKTIRFVIPALICLLVIILFAWNEIFTIFHQIFFPNGNWSFPADSLIIQLFPDQFWWGMAMGYVGMVGAKIGFISLISRKY